jgi:hypothetical protein
MMIDKFIDEKISQSIYYINAVLNHVLHPTELDQFITDTMDEWTLLKIQEEAPNNAKERVFWHVIHEVSLHGAHSLNDNLYFKSEITTCIDFFKGTGSYPVDCVGWRPLP